MIAWVQIILYTTGIIVLGIFVGYFIDKMERKNIKKEKIKLLDEYLDTLDKNNSKK